MRREALDEASRYILAEAHAFDARLLRAQLEFDEAERVHDEARVEAARQIDSTKLEAAEAKARAKEEV